MRARTDGQRRGFSLVEMFVSLFIVAATLSMITSLHFQARSHQIESAAVVQATLLADSLLAEVEVTPRDGRAELPGEGQYETLSNRPGARTLFHWQRSLAPTDAGTTRADVEVYWLRPNQGERRLSFSQEVYP